MKELYDAFLDLCRKINDDAIVVFNDTLTYILTFLSIDKNTGVEWNHSAKDNEAFSGFFSTYLYVFQEKVKISSWYDAWGDLFMELAGKFKSFRGQFFTPDGVCDLCSRISIQQPNGRPTINDCACGSGRMLLSANGTAYDRGCIQPYLIGEDIDGMCCKMTAINMAMHGCRGEVIKHDSLGHPDELSYGYIINERLVPSIQISRNKADFIKFRI